MNFTFTPKRAKFNVLLCFVMVVFAKQFVFAQSIPINATIVSNQNEVDFSSNAIDGDLSTKAEIRASSGILVGIGAYSGFLELEFPSVLPANTTSYVKIDCDDNLLPAIVGGNLGGLLSDLLGTALIGNQEFTVQAKNGNALVLEGNSQIINDFASNNLRIVVNAQNDYFIAITPSQAYNRIRIINRVGSLIGLNKIKKLGVYGAFYIQTQDNCGSASYTSFSGTGLNLDALNLGGAGVTNPSFVIDGNPNNFSKLSLGIIGVAASIEQTVYFDGLSESSDQFLVRLRVDPSLLALGAANNIQILGYNDFTLVQAVNLNSLLNLDLLTLLQNNQEATIPFSPNSPVNRITIRYNSLLNVQLTQSLDLYDIKRVPPPPVITDSFTLNPIICAGTTASLIAEAVPGTTINWYSQPSGGTLLATTNSGEAYVTGVLTQDTSFYIAASDSNCPHESLRIQIAVDIVDIPTADDIIIGSTLDACNGSIVLSPISTIGGAVFKFYKDQLKTQEITTGYSGDVGVNYVLNSSTGQLTISGLTAINSPYSYYISLSTNGCENEINDLKEVIVNFSSGLTLNVSSSLEGCGSVNLLDSILNLDLSGTIQYTFFDALNNAISIVAATNIVTSGVYTIQSVSLLGGCLSSSQQVSVTVNQVPTLIIPNTHIIANIGDSVTLNATSNSTITWYDSNGSVLASNVVGPFTNAGLYTYTAVANNGSCSIVGTIYVTVIDSSDCPTLTGRVYATSQSWGSILTGGVFNPSNAIDQNLKTFSTIVTGIGLLGVGTTWQTLEWDNTIPAGTPITVKLGSEYSGLIAAGAYSIVGTKRDISGTPEKIGNIQPISGSLLDFLPGENSFEFTFVPSDSTGPKDYDGVRIIVGSVASIAQNVKVYEAYYNEPITQLDCALGDVKDVFGGAIDLGVGVVTNTVGVDNRYDAVDDSLSSYATMYSGVGVLAAADLTVVFNTPTLENESIQLLMSRPNTVLSLNLLTGFSIQMFMGDVPVGPILYNSSTLLNLELLNGGTEALLTVIPQTFNFDKIKIRFGGVAGVLDILRIHDVNRIYNTNIVDADSTNTIQTCTGDTIELEVTPQDCVTFIWYDAQIGGNIVSTGTTFTIPDGLVSGSYDYYIQPVRYGCETFKRGKVTVVINNAPQNAINLVNINGNSDTDICSDLGVVTLNAQLNSSLTITNPIFHWYSFNGINQELIANETQSTIVLSNLSPGAHTYYVGISSDEFCQTLEADRTEVTFTIRPFSQASDIVVDDVTACSVNEVSLNPTSTNQNPQFSWFFTNDNTQPIVNGTTVGNLTFAISLNGTLTVSGLDVINSPFTYYVGLISETTCLNDAGNFKSVTITISNGTTPTTNSASQTFCLVTNPTVADIQVNEPNVSWFTTQIGGTALASTEALVDGTIYYASIVDSFGCESGTRLEVSVSISNGTTPTTNSTSQTFCLASNPTVADIQVNEPNVSWFTSAIGGTALASTEALVDGTVYYASIIDGSGCESGTRLEVSVLISNGTTPTTNSASQTFCLVTNPTVADIQVNEPNVSWFTTAIAGTPLASTEALVDGTVYYASIIDSFGCESGIRLEVSVSISNGTTPTTNSASQTFCLASNPTVTNIQVNESNVSWFTSAIGGTALASTEALVDGTIYYASIVDGSGCESETRLEVSVSISNGTTPTTNSTSQTFCLASNPTVADIQVNEPNVSWFTTPIGGTALASTEALVDGTVYYASIVDGFGCESGTRLEVSVSIINGTTPTTNSASQTFCLMTNPTVADIQVNEPNVSWFTTAIGGTALTSTEALVDGTVYYASIVDGFGCESGIRLEVTATLINNGITQISGGSNESCISEEVTYTTVSGMTDYIWTITNGSIVSGGQVTDDFVTVLWTSIGTGTISVSYVNSCSGINSGNLNVGIVACSDLTISKTVNNLAPMIGENIVFTITVNNVGASQITDLVVLELLPSGYAFVNSNTSVGTYNNLNGIWNIPVVGSNQSVTLLITATVLSSGDYTNIVTIETSTPIDIDLNNNTAQVTTQPLCLIVYNEFSPNGDGSNDFFTIDCIERFPDNKLEVFNRYGMLVYSKKGYTNEWDGTANVSGTVNKDEKLPTGTYYYILDIGEKETKKNGWLSIVR